MKKLLALLILLFPATAGLPAERPQVFGSVSAFYLDAFGVAAGPSVAFRDGSALAFQVMARRTLDGRDDAQLRIGCRTANCAGCRNPSEVGFIVTYTFGRAARRPSGSSPYQNTKH